MGRIGSRNSHTRSRMHRVLANDQLSPNVTASSSRRPRIAEIRQPGQFVIVRLGPGAERIPLTIADGDAGARARSRLVIQADRQEHDRPRRARAGRRHRATSPARSAGRPSSSSAGTPSASAAAWAPPSSCRSPRSSSRRGVAVTSIIGGRSREWVILEPELAECGEVVTCTDDGSYGRPGFVTEALARRARRAAASTTVYAVGPVPMMRAVAGAHPARSA